MKYKLLKDKLFNHEFFNLRIFWTTRIICNQFTDFEPRRNWTNWFLEECHWICYPLGRKASFKFIQKTHQGFTMEKRDLSLQFHIGNFYHIDKGFSNGGKVKLLDFGKIYCRVEDPETGQTWTTMLNRLSKWTDKVIS